MTDFIENAIWLLINILIIAVPLFTFGFFADKLSCEATAKVLGFTPHYAILTGCVVEKPNGTRVLLDQIRNVGISWEQ